MAAAGMRASARRDRRLHATRGAVVFAVCAGFQLLGHHVRAGDGDILDGLGLVDLRHRGRRRPPDRRGASSSPRPRPGSPPSPASRTTAAAPPSAPASRRSAGSTVGHGNGVDGVDGVLADRHPRHLPPRPGAPPQPRARRPAAGVGRRRRRADTARRPRVDAASRTARATRLRGSRPPPRLHSTGLTPPAVATWQPQPRLSAPSVLLARRARGSCSIFSAAWLASAPWVASSSTARRLGLGGGAGVGRRDHGVDAVFHDLLGGRRRAPRPSRPRARPARPGP